MIYDLINFITIVEIYGSLLITVRWICKIYYILRHLRQLQNIITSIKKLAENNGIHEGYLKFSAVVKEMTDTFENIIALNFTCKTLHYMHTKKFLANVIYDFTECGSWFKKMIFKGFFSIFWLYFLLLKSSFLVKHFWKCKM